LPTGLQTLPPSCAQVRSRIVSRQRWGTGVSQLTYGPNGIGGGSTDPRDSGLTAYGAQIVERMNTLGMAVDISHCADKITLDAIEVSRKPVLITHANCRALMKTSARCKSDAAIRRMAAKGGVIGSRWSASSSAPQILSRSRTLWITSILWSTWLNWAGTLPKETIPIKPLDIDVNDSCG